MIHFYDDAAKGTLPKFSFIEPRMSSDPGKYYEPDFGLSNWQHPVSSILEGERLLKMMYEALRNGPKWKSTMFIIT
jgi:phospholipase C